MRETAVRISLLSFLLSTCLLASCGAEVASTAATAGKLQAEQAQQAKKQQEQVKQNLDSALQAGQSRAASAPGQ